MSTESPPAMEPIGPMARYEVKVRPLGDSVYVEACLYRQWMTSKGVQWMPDLMDRVGDGSTVFVNPPNALMRWFGDTWEKRIERARAKVTRWAEREIEREGKAHEMAERCASS